jgi:hypothetical protein
MNLRQLQNLLIRIARLADSVGGRGQAGDLRVLAEVLAEERVSSVTEAVVQIRSRLARSGRGRQADSPTRRRQQSGRPTISVDEYVRKLECAREDADIYPLLEAFRDKAFKKAELDKIAHRYAKGPVKYKRKADAIDDIEGRFFQRRRSANEIDFLERKKVTPW